MNTPMHCVRDRYAVEVVEKIKLPAVLRLGQNLYALQFHCMKVVVALHMLREALADDRLRRDGLVVETSSGTFALALALAGAALGVRIHIVGDPGIDAGLLQRLEILGAVVDIMQPQPGRSLQEIRLDRLEQIRADNPGAYWPGQYHSPDNRLAYHDIADFAAAQLLCDVDVLVGCVGSGGSTGGIGERLREKGHGTSLVAVDTHGSVLFGHRDRPRLLRGLGNSILPANVHHADFDAVHWIPPGLAFSSARSFFANFSLDVGPTSGAALLVARQLAAESPHANVLVICPDTGERYRSNVLDRAWLKERGLLVDVATATPTTVPEPADDFTGWARMNWNRRTLAEVMRDKGTSS